MPRAQQGVIFGVSLIVGAMAAVPARADGSATWPQWRGPERDATVTATAWPDRLEMKPLWRVPLGPSYSGPIVGADRVFVTETHDKKQEIVRALDRATGQELWSTAWDGSMKVPFFAARNGSWIRATPTYDGERLYVGGMREVLVALDGATGDEVWKIDFPAEYGTKMGDFGFVCSPLVDGEHLYVEAAQSVFKLKAATGEVVWRTESFPGGMMSSGTFSSPIIATLAGQRQLLVQTRQMLIGIDLDSGELLWSQEVPSFRGMNILTPTVYGDSIFTSTHRNASFLYTVSRDDAGTWSVTEEWRNPADAYMSSPVLVGDHAYVHLGNGRLTSIDLRSGESAWTSKPMGDYWSMAVQDDRILALSSEGTLLLLDASPAGFSLRDQYEIEVDSETWGHVAVAGDVVYVRALHEVIALQWTTPASPEMASAP